MKKLWIGFLACLFTIGAWSAAELYVNDSSTWRKAVAVYVNDSGTWRDIQEIYVNDSGTWRSVFVKGYLDFSGVTDSVDIPEVGLFAGYSEGLGLGTISPSPANVTFCTGRVYSLIDDYTGGYQSTTFSAVCTADPGQSAFTSISIVGGGSGTLTSASAGYFWDSGPGIAYWTWYAPSVLGAPFSYTLTINP